MCYCRTHDNGNEQMLHVFLVPNEMRDVQRVLSDISESTGISEGFVLGRLAE